MLKAELCLRPRGTIMDSFTHHRRPMTRSLSAGETLTRSATFHALSSAYDHRDERRTSIASYVPQSEDQNGNFPVKDIDRQEAKFLGKLNTDEVCQWFTGIRLTKCVPFIREAKLRGADIAAVDMDILDTLHITTLEDREHLLSAIYNELHPPNAVTQRLDSLLESVGPADIKTFTETLASMSKSRSSPHVSCLSANRRSLKLRGNSQKNYTLQRNSQLMEITINASQRIVHLRTPKETTVAKVIESCIKMLGTTDDKSLFALKETAGSSEDLLPERQIGTLLKSTSEQTQLELHLCKMDKPSGPAPQNNSESNSSDENGCKSVQVSQTAKSERIKELKEQVDSLQNVILQIQELHHDLVAFCSELKSMDSDTKVDRLGCEELEQKLELVKSTLNNKKESLRSLRDNASNPSCQRRKQVDVRLLEKMRLNCQVFKEEISIVHLNRQVAHLQSALQESYDEIQEKAQKRKSLAIGSLSQLVSPQSPVMLLVVQEQHSANGRYGFTCRYREGSGLVVDAVDSCHLCVGDRLVEVNGVPVVNATAGELTELLRRGPSAQIAVLRHPPLGPASQQQHPPLPSVPGSMQNISLARAAVAMETPAQRKVIAM